MKCLTAFCRAAKRLRCQKSVVRLDMVYGFRPRGTREESSSPPTAGFSDRAVSGSPTAESLFRWELGTPPPDHRPAAIGWKMVVI